MDGLETELEDRMAFSLLDAENEEWSCSAPWARRSCPVRPEEMRNDVNRVA